MHNFTPAEKNKQTDFSVSDFDQQFNQLLPYFIQFKKENLYNNFRYEDYSQSYYPPHGFYDQTYLTNPMMFNNFCFQNFNDNLFQPPQMADHNLFYKDESHKILNNYVTNINFDCLKEKFLRHRNFEDKNDSVIQKTDFISQMIDSEVVAKEISIEEIRKCFDLEKKEKSEKIAIRLKINGKELLIMKYDNLFSKISVFCQENKLSNKILMKIFKRIEKSMKILQWIYKKSFDLIDIEALLKRNSICIVQATRKMKRSISCSHSMDFSLRVQERIMKVI